jgi:hypothetical protein
MFNITQCALTDYFPHHCSELVVVEHQTDWQTSWLKCRRQQLERYLFGISHTLTIIMKHTMSECSLTALMVSCHQLYSFKLKSKLHPSQRGFINSKSAITNSVTNQNLALPSVCSQGEFDSVNLNIGLR